MTPTAGMPNGNQWRLAGWGIAAALLLVPLLATAFTDSMNWGAEDFAAAALLLGGVGLSLEVAMRLVSGPRARIGAAIAIVAAFALIWAELAVGVFH